MKNTPDYHHVIEAALLDIAKSSRTERVKSLQAEALSELEMRLNGSNGRKNALVSQQYWPANPKG